MGDERRSMTFRNSQKDDPTGPMHQASTKQAQIAEVYAEMFTLLEEYAPTWYTEDLHYRAAAGLEELRAGNNLPAQSIRWQPALVYPWNL